MRSVRWVENELREIPTYEGLPNLAAFLSDFEELVTGSQHLSTLDQVLKATPPRWWGMHKQSISEWPKYRRLLEVIFSEEFTTVIHKYTGLSNPVEHTN